MAGICRLRALPGLSHDKHHRVATLDPAQAPPAIVQLDIIALRLSEEEALSPVETARTDSICSLTVFAILHFTFVSESCSKKNLNCQ